MPKFDDKAQRRTARSGNGPSAAMRIAALNEKYPDLESVETQLQGTRAGATLTEIIDFVTDLREDMVERILSSPVGRNMTEERLESMDFQTIRALADTAVDAQAIAEPSGRRAARRAKTRAASCDCNRRRSDRREAAYSGYGDEEFDDEPSYAGRSGGGARREAREETAPEAPSVFPMGGSGTRMSKEERDDRLR